MGGDCGVGRVGGCGLGKWESGMGMEGRGVWGVGGGELEEWADGGGGDGGGG